MQVKQKALLFVFLILGLFCFSSACHAEEVRVELVWKFPDPGWLEVEVRKGIYFLNYDKASYPYKPEHSFKVGQSGLSQFINTGRDFIILEKPVITFFSEDKEGIFRVREPGKDWVSYRGNLQIIREGINWKLTNTVDREDYLKGVVPIEMSNAWAPKGFEALKAQAVAARTYLIKNLDARGTITDSPNIHQAYWGRTVEGAASRAVEITSGEILVDKNTGEPISVFYSSHNGGYTELTENVWTNHDPHYSSFPDPFSRGIGGYLDDWIFLISAEALGKAFELAPVRKVELDAYPSGRVYRVHLYDWLDNKKTVTGGSFVQKFYPYDRAINTYSFLGRLFQAEYIMPDISQAEHSVGFKAGRELPPGPVISRLISSNEGISDIPSNYGVFVFRGRGWGHGVGMSQWGAYNMAMQGYSYEDILHYYYKNVSIGSLQS